MAISTVSTSISSTGFPANPNNFTGVAAVLGPCSSGTLSAVQKWTNSELNNLADTLGTGPLVDDALEILKGGTSVITVKAATSTAGSLQGARQVSGSTTTEAVADVPNVSFTGTPLGKFDIVIEILSSGIVTDMTFRYSVDGEDTWSPTIQGQTTYSIANPVTGITAAFATTPLATDYVDGDKYYVNSLAPESTISDINIAKTALVDSGLTFSHILVTSIAASSFATTWKTSLDTMQSSDNIYVSSTLKADNQTGPLILNGSTDGFGLTITGGTNALSVTDIVPAASTNSNLKVVAADLTTKINALAPTTVAVIANPDGTLTIDTIDGTAVAISEPAAGVSAVSRLFGTSLLANEELTDVTLFTGSVPSVEESANWATRLIDVDWTSFTGSDRIGVFAGGYEIQSPLNGKIYARNGAASYVGRAMTQVVSQSAAERSSSYPGVQSLVPSKITKANRDKLSNALFIIPIKSAGGLYVTDEDLLRYPDANVWTHLHLARTRDALMTRLYRVADSFTAHRTDNESINAFRKGLQGIMDRAVLDAEITSGTVTVPAQDWTAVAQITINASFVNIGVTKNFLLNFGLNVQNPLL